MSEPWELGVGAAARAIAARVLSSQELVESLLRRIEATEPFVHAYAHLDAEEALRESARCDEATARGAELGPLHGVPIAVKDLIWTRTGPTTAGSAVLDGWVAPHDATVVRLLREAGAIPMGKTVTHEFGTSQDEPPTRNAWDPARQPGGSSAGSGAAVAARSALAALGTDSGGSTRKPAAFNGVAGLKPTYGRVSRHGVIYPGSSMDQAGPIARSVSDVALLMDVLAGPDPLDPSSAPYPAGDHTGRLREPVRGRLGVPGQYFGPGLSGEVRAVVEQALALLESLGFELVEVDIPLLEHAGAAGYCVLMVEQAAFHQRWLRTERITGYTRETRWLLAAGSLIPATHYQAANRYRAALTEQVREVFARHELLALAGPTTPAVAQPVGAVANPTYVPDAVRYTVPGNLTGLPCLTVPCGFDADHLPVGLQLTGRAFREPELLRIAQSYEDATSWHRETPRYP